MNCTTPYPSQELSRFHDFESAARAVLRFLQLRVGFDLWMVTRVRGAEWIVLQAVDSGCGVHEGETVTWTDESAPRALEGQRSLVPGFSNSARGSLITSAGRRLRFAAWISAPIALGEDAHFGTLCALHPGAVPDSAGAELPLVELLAGLLAALLESETRLEEQERRAEHALAESMRDALTGLQSRRGWDRTLAAEEKRCRRYGHSACVFSLDLDGLKSINDSQGHAAGDKLLQRAALALRSAVREEDSVARLGGDEFQVLAVECDRDGGRELHDRLRAALEAAGVAASIGFAMRDPARDLNDAVQQADLAMFAAKRRRAADARRRARNANSARTSDQSALF